MVSIVAFQAMDPGSIPGRRTLFLMVSNFVQSYITLDSHGIFGPGIQHSCAKAIQIIVRVLIV